MIVRAHFDVKPRRELEYPEFPRTRRKLALDPISGGRRTDSEVKRTRRRFADAITANASRRAGVRTLIASSPTQIGNTGVMLFLRADNGGHRIPTAHVEKFATV